MQKKKANNKSFWVIFQQAQLKALQLEESCKKFEKLNIKKYLIGKNVPEQMAQELHDMVKQYIKTHPWK